MLLFAKPCYPWGLGAFIRFQVVRIGTTGESRLQGALCLAFAPSKVIPFKSSIPSRKENDVTRVLNHEYKPTVQLPKNACIFSACAHNLFLKYFLILVVAFDVYYQKFIDCLHKIKPSLLQFAYFKANTANEKTISKFKWFCKFSI